MKKGINLVLLLLVGLFVSFISVKAEDYYYINDNGVTFTREQYEFISEMYYDGYQAYMTEDDMAYFDGIDMIPGTVETKTYEDFSYIGGGYQLMATSHETASKRLKIAKSGSAVAVTCAWKKSPNVRSYDLIGVYLNGPSIIGSGSARINYSGGTIYPSNEKQPSNGYGAVIKLPTGGNSIVASTTFAVTGSGRIYGSYQHAAASISLANASSFTIGNGGLGNVFKFSSTTISNKYDAMGGVFIDA